MSHHTPLEADRHLVGAMAQGDAEALRTLHERHGRTVYALAYGILVDPTDAEEVVSETFAYVWQAARRWVETADQPVSGWLKEIARSRARGLLLAREWPGRLVPVRAQGAYFMLEEIQ
jgi:DNA-directed RNA polymerase specialized sigma24 family protein